MREAPLFSPSPSVLSTWNAQVAEGRIPASWASDPRRSFVRSMRCPYCEGRGHDPWNPCVCDHGQEEVELAYPPTAEDCARVAASIDLLTRAESLAHEAAAQLTRHSAPRAVCWLLGGKRRRQLALPAALLQLDHDLAVALGRDRIARRQPASRAAWIAAVREIEEARREAVRRGNAPASAGEGEGPVAPLLALAEMGVLLIGISPEVVALQWFAKGG